MNYLLVDFENIQPKWLDKLDTNKWCIITFIGPKQCSVSSNYAISKQKFGHGSKYVKVRHSGPNSLDFHLAYELGQLSQIDPHGVYHVASKDKGYDPLIKSLKNSGLTVFRSEIIE